MGNHVPLPGASASLTVEKAHLPIGDIGLFYQRGTHLIAGKDAEQMNWRPIGRF